MRNFLTFGRCPVCKTHIFARKLIKTWTPKQKKCPTCNVEIVEHPATRFIWILLVVILFLYEIYVEDFIKDVFEKDYFIYSLSILSSIGFIGLFFIWCLGYKEARKNQKRSKRIVH